MVVGTDSTVSSAASKALALLTLVALTTAVGCTNSPPTEARIDAGDLPTLSSDIASELLDREVAASDDLVPATDGPTSIEEEPFVGTDAAGDLGTDRPPAPPVDGGPPPECRTDVDCNDRIDCTEDRCVGNRCLRTPQPIRCDDRIDCTEDVCASSGCSHRPVPARCPGGATCDVTMGCQRGRICATNTDCADTDPCTVRERCDPAARVCRFDTLDGDADGDPPRVCGGGDCDDSSPLVRRDGQERCDGVDNDCDGSIDEEGPIACARGSRCERGRCECPSGERTCGGECVNTATNRNHCGGCFTVCDERATGCRDGTCTCPVGLRLCGGRCVDLQTDTQNCGACDNWCGANFQCLSGRCSCAPGRTVCGSTCADLQTDVRNCGSCSNRCPTGATCSSGVCRCPEGESDCYGVCTNLGRSSSHCGACGNRCPSWSAYCFESRCQSCPPPQADCGSGCIDTSTSQTHCGGCYRRCENGTCQGGRCVCAPGFTSCGGTCVDVQTSAEHCGMCFQRCTNIGPGDGGSSLVPGMCRAGRCACEGPDRQLCPSTVSWFDAGATGLICTETRTNNNACGACDRRCSRATEQCTDGVCACHRCNGVCADLSTDSNCGRCGNRCPSGIRCRESFIGYFCY